MKKKQVFMSLALLAVIVAVAMYIIGGDSGNLTELRDLFWVPLPLAAVLYLVGMKSKE